MTVKCKNTRCRKNSGGECKRDDIQLDNFGFCHSDEPKDCCGTCRFYIGGVCEKFDFSRIQVEKYTKACTLYEEKE